MGLTFYKPITKSHLSPLLSAPIPAGLPVDISFEGEGLDLNEFVSFGDVADGLTVYFFVNGNSMIERNISHGDLVVVSRSLQPLTGNVVIAHLPEGYTLKTYQLNRRGLFLVPANPEYHPRKVNEDEDFDVWGVVTHILKRI